MAAEFPSKRESEERRPDEVAQRRAWGLINRKPRWGLSGRGWLIGVGLVALLALTVGQGLYPFLAVTEPVKTDVLVVEGWVHVSAVKVAAVTFEKDGYRRVFATGGPVQGNGGYTNDYSTSANIGAGRLRNEGVPADRVQSVPSRVADKDRTYFSAVALRVWLKEHEPSVRAVNILTEDVHARRTRLLFEKALGDEFQVGIIAVESPDYDAQHWWRYSEGVRAVIGETIAYFYARVIFQSS